MTLDSNMLGNIMWSTLFHAYKNIILYQWTGLGNYIVDLVWIENINTNMSLCIFQDVWRAPCMNINTKFWHSPIMHHTNRKDQIMGPKLSGQSIIATNISSHLKTKNIYKMW